MVSGSGSMAFGFCVQSAVGERIDYAPVCGIVSRSHGRSAEDKEQYRQCSARLGNDRVSELGQFAFFMYIVPYFAVAVFMIVLGVYLCVNYKWGGICSIILMACSMGIYQAYLPFAATLYVVLLLMRLFDDEEVMPVIRSAVYYFINIVLGVGLYFILTKLSLLVTGEELTQTKGIDTMGQFDVSRISEIVKTIFRNITGVFCGNDLEISYNYAVRLMYLILFLCSVYCVARIIIRAYRRKEYLRCAAVFVLISAFEIAINSIYIMCSEGIYSLMYFSYVFLMLLPLCMLEHSAQWKQNKVYLCAEYVTAAGLMIGIVSYCHFANAQYLSIELSYKQAESYCTTLITQIKSVEGYSDELPVAFVGHNIKDKTLYENNVMDAVFLSGREVTLVEAYSREYLCGIIAVLIRSMSPRIGLMRTKLMRCRCTRTQGRSR